MRTHARFTLSRLLNGLVANQRRGGFKNRPALDLQKRCLKPVPTGNEDKAVAVTAAAAAAMHFTTTIPLPSQPTFSILGPYALAIRPLTPVSDEERQV